MAVQQEYLETLWMRMLETFPFPGAMLDRQGCYLYLNEASRADPVLQRGRIGASLVESCRAEEHLMKYALRRKLYFRETLLTGESHFFVEEMSDKHARATLWLYMPVPGPTEDPHTCTLLGFDVTGWRHQETTGWEHSIAYLPDAHQSLFYTAIDDMQLSLSAIVSLARSMTVTLPDSEGEQANLIEQNGVRLLHQCDVLKKYVLPNVPGNNGASS